MSEYDSVIYLYLQITRSWNWTPDQIDNINIEILFEYIAAISMEDSEEAYIDEIL